MMCKKCLLSKLVNMQIKFNFHTRQLSIYFEKGIIFQEPHSYLPSSNFHLRPSNAMGQCQPEIRDPGGQWGGGAFDVHPLLLFGFP